MAQLNKAMDLATFRDSAAAQTGLIRPPAGQRLGAMSLDRWQALVDQLIDLKIIKGPLDPRTLFVDM